MIRYQRISRADLEAMVDALQPAWRGKAKLRQDAFVAAGKFSEAGSIWSDIKPVFMALQHDKCIYCERVLGGMKAGRLEQDVEHYRPKGRVLSWPHPGKVPPINYDFHTGDPSKSGYYWLAYELDNYACSCKACNSDRKRDYFPIAGTRASAVAGIAALNRLEKPFLIFPQGGHGDDPERFITFRGVLAVPVPRSGAALRRAQVTIEFFDLNDREELLADRARTIRELFKAIELSETGRDPVRAAARRDVESMISEAAPQASCARAYLRLARANADEAFSIYQETERYLGHGRRRR